MVCSGSGGVTSSMIAIFFSVLAVFMGGGITAFCRGAGSIGAQAQKETAIKKRALKKIKKGTGEEDGVFRESLRLYKTIIPY
jgi:hypothetical protein